MTNPRNDTKIPFKIKNSHLKTGREILTGTETINSYHLEKEVSTQDAMEAQGEISTHTQKMEWRDSTQR